ncbi:hypothetical protein C8J57DRAFT_1240786 [Mycena rebaudengoi]|nr:hypothetical protein C8J57DRAFT_1240786 [Mycena rebaudengoi]
MKLIPKAGAWALGPGLEALSEGSGSGLGLQNPEPKPAQAGPRPGLLGRAGPWASLILCHIAAALPDAAVPVPPVLSMPTSAIYLPSSSCSMLPFTRFQARLHTRPPNNRRKIFFVPIALYFGCSTLNAGRPSSSPLQVSAVFSIPPQSATSRWCPLELGQRIQRVYKETARVSARKVEPPHRTSPALLFFAADLACSLPGSRLSSYTAEKAGGRAKWVGVFEFQSPTRPPSASLPPRRFQVLKHPFCVDENPRLAACTAWDCLPALRTHIASISGIHESTPTAIDTAFSVQGVVPATRLSLATPSHNSYRARGYTHPNLSQQEGSGTHPTTFRSAAAHSPAA